MQEQIEHQWIKDSDFLNNNPLQVTIVDFVANGKDRILIFKLQDGTTRQMSMWGENKNALIRKFGSESDLWKAQTVRIMLYTDAGDNKKKRKVEA